MNMATGFDAVIIGAGPAGSCVAILLARSGWRVALIEKQGFPRRKVCGECIAASNLPLLDALGVGSAFLRLAGPPLRQVGLTIGDEVLRADLPAYAHDNHRWGVALGREHLDTLLLEQAIRCGAQLFQPWTAREIHGKPGAFICRIEQVHERETFTLTAPVLIDARGSWEAASGIGKTLHRQSDLFAFKANFSQVKLDHGLLPVLSFPGGYGGMVIADHGIATLAFCIRRETLAASRHQMPGRHRAADAAAAYIAQQCKGVRAALAEAEQCAQWLAVGPVRPGIRIADDSRHAFLVGNAAGEAHPIIGEGISMALQSGWLLAHMLAPYRPQIADADALVTLQQKYAHVWRHHFSGRIRLAALLAHAAMRPRLTAAMLPLLRRYPVLLSKLACWSGKVRPAPQVQAIPTAGYQ